MLCAISSGKTYIAISRRGAVILPLTQLMLIRNASVKIESIEHISLKRKRANGIQLPPTQEEVVHCGLEKYTVNNML